jgi:hypothetical protein
MRRRVASFAAFHVNSVKRLAAALPVVLALSFGAGVAHAACSGTTTVTCTSGSAVTVNGPASSGTYNPATVYPAGNVVPGTVTGTVTSVIVTLNTFTALSSNSAFGTQGLSMMLVSPDGRQFEFFRAIGDGSQSLNFTALTFSDSGAIPAPDPNNFFTSASGSPTFKPSAYDADLSSPTNYVSPGPGHPAHTAANLGSGTFTNVFTGAVAAGTWNLYAVDHSDPTDHITFANWTLVLGVSATSSSTSTGLVSNLNPSFTSGANGPVTFTATVTSTSTPTGSVTFLNGASAMCSGVALNGSGQAACPTTIGTEGNQSITAVYNPTGSFATSTSPALIQVVRNHSTNPTTNQYCNTGSISAPGTPTTQLIYPSFLNVPALGNTVAAVSVNLKGLAGPNGLGAAQFLLVAPDGSHNLDFLSHAGFSGGQGSVNGTITDNNPSAPNNSAFPNNFLYQPTDDHNQADTFGQPPLPAPQLPASIKLAQPSPGSVTLNQEFSGVTGAGDWLLYLYDNGGSSSAVSLTGGWCLTFTLNTGTPTTLNLTSNPNPARGGQAVAFTATVTNSNTSAPVTTGTVTFTENGSPLTGGGNNVVTLNGSGVAVYTTSNLPEGDHTILATYTGSFNSSNMSLSQRVDNNSTISGINGNLVSFCNTGAILIPGVASPFNIGRANPNPSNIFAAQLPGITSIVGVTLNNFFTTQNMTQELASLLVGPGGGNTNTLDFFSGTGASNTILSMGNYSFKDSATNQVPASAFAPGSYKPTAHGGADTFFSTTGFFTLPAGPYQYAAPAGTKTFGNTYGNADGNGTWSLYFNQNIHADDAGANNGWCVDFTQTAPTITATKGPSGLHVIQGDVGDAVTVVVHNAGSGGAGGAIPLKVTDTFPTGLTPTGGSGTNWSCGAAVGQAITCTSTDFIASGNNFPTLTINFNVSPTLTAPGSVTNTASISGSALTSGVNSNTLTITVDPAPDVTVTAGHTGTFTQGSTGTLTITGHNIVASSATHGTTTVVDTLPTGWTLNSFSGGTWTCGSLTNVVTCTTSQAVNGGSDYSVLSLVVNVPTTSAVSVSHSVTISGGGELSTSTANDTSSDNLTVIQVPASISINGSATQSTAINTAFGSLAVTVKDAGGVVIPNYSSVVFTAPASGASGTFSTTTNTKTLPTAAVTGIADPGAFTANGTAGGTYSLGVVAGTATATFTLTNTDIPATVTNVAATNSNGTYGVGAVINITVAFSKAVNVTGTPQLALNSGGTASYSSGSGTATLTFAYTVAGGQTSADLDYTSTTALTLSGGSINNLSTTPATLTLPAPAGAGSLGANKNIVIDSTAPTVTSVTATTADGTYGVGATIAITATFSEVVNVTGTPQLALNSGGTANYSSGSGTATLTFTYAVAAGQNSPDLDYTSTSALALNGGAIKDGGLNNATLTLPAPAAAGSLGANKNIVIDTTGPTVTNVTSTTANGTYGAGAVIAITATFSETVNVTGTPQLSLNSGGTASYSSGSGTATLTFTYTVAAGQNSPDLDYTSTSALALNGGTIKDGALNSATLILPAPGAAGSLGNNKNIVIDTTGTTVTNVTSTIADGTYGVAAVIPITVTFNKTVAVTGTPLLALNSGGTASYSSGSGTATLTFTYSVGAGQNSADLDYTSTSALSLNGGTIQDLNANNATLTLPAPGAAGSLGFNKNIVISTGGPAADVTAQFTVTPGGLTFNRVTGKYSLPIALTNNGPSLSAVAFVLDNLSAGNTVVTPSGTTSATSPAGSPYVEIGPIASGASIVFVIPFTHTGTLAITDTPRLLGPGLR